MAGQWWCRIDADYFGNPKALAAGKDGRALHLASICWSAQHLTDGAVPTAVVPTLLGMAGVKKGAVDLVVDAGLWVPNGDDSWHIHDYAKFNPTRAEVEAEREGWRERQRRFRARQSRPGT